MCARVIINFENICCCCAVLAQCGISLLYFLFLCILSWFDVIYIEHIYVFYRFIQFLLYKFVYFVSNKMRET